MLVAFIWKASSFILKRKNFVLSYQDGFLRELSQWGTEGKGKYQWISFSYQLGLYFQNNKEGSNILNFNFALLTKWAWKLLSGLEANWKNQMIKAYYGRRNLGMQVRRSTKKASLVWKKISKGLKKFWNYLMHCDPWFDHQDSAFHDSLYSGTCIVQRCISRSYWIWRTCYTDGFCVFSAVLWYALVCLKVQMLWCVQKCTYIHRIG